MKVFISSTCYDLLDLRHELHAELHDLGINAVLSDIEQSAFKTSGKADQTSIDTCLSNLRDCDEVVVILSQRYGTVLGEPYGEFSATQLEYEEARRLKMPIHFYIRDRLVGEWTSWRRNRPRPDKPNRRRAPERFKTDWVKQDDAEELFAFIERHRKIKRGDEDNKNNWYWQFSTSVDLRDALRRRFAAQAYRAAAEKLIRDGKVPILVVMGQGITPYGEQPNDYIRLTFTLLNASVLPAVDVRGLVRLGKSCPFSDASTRIAALLPGDDVATRIARQMQFDIPRNLLLGAWDAHNERKAVFLDCQLDLTYLTSSGHHFMDSSAFTLLMGSDPPTYQALPLYLGKAVLGMETPFMPIDASK